MEVIKPKQLTPDDQNFLLSATHIFWDVDKSKLDFEKHYRSIITQVLNYGSPEDVQRIFRIYNEDAMKDTLRRPIKGVWFPHLYKAFCCLFDVAPDKKANNIMYLGKKTRNRVKGIFRNL